MYAAATRRNARGLSVSVYRRNEKDAQFHRVSVLNRLLRLSTNGDLWYVTK